MHRKSKGFGYNATHLTQGASRAVMPMKHNNYVTVWTSLIRDNGRLPTFNKLLSYAAVLRTSNEMSNLHPSEA